MGGSTLQLTHRVTLEESFSLAGSWVPIPEKEWCWSLRTLLGENFREPGIREEVRNTLLPLDFSVGSKWEEAGPASTLAWILSRDPATWGPEKMHVLFGPGSRLIWKRMASGKPAVKTAVICLRGLWVRTFRWRDTVKKKYRHLPQIMNGYSINSSIDYSSELPNPGNKGWENL